MAFRVLDWVKWCGEFTDLCVKAVGLLGGAKVAKAILVAYSERRVESMETAWRETEALLKELQEGGGPEQVYFPHFLRECKAKLEVIIQEASDLELEWTTDPETVKKYIWPQKSYAQLAKAKIDTLHGLQKGLRTSSTEAYYLRSHDHPAPRPDEILRPSNVPWPESSKSQIPYIRTMSTGDHRAQRQAETYFTTPQQAPRQVQSPTSSAGPHNRFGPTLPGIRPTGEAAYPYLPGQAPIPGHRSNSMPVPREYAHFNNVNASAYGHAVPPHPTSPYSNMEYATSTISTSAFTTAYAPHGEHPPQVPRRR
ncbi:hypothetical protein AURDEDRAFT_162262 [Auricularia subglabra TFB-10046 SS5]|nr:hypothetical protein AURDEDRAFT_162262 [Auricularia subglabra TFB-10046 SS5]